MFLSSVIAKSKGFLVLGEYTEALMGLNSYKETGYEFLPPKAMTLL